MNVVVASDRDADVRPLRQVLLGAGLECLATDCVAWQDLPARLAREDAELIVVKTDPSGYAEWSTVREAATLSSAPVIAVGPAVNGEAAALARRAGLSQYLSEENLRNDLDALLDRMTRSRSIGRVRNTVVSVVAPTPGSGGKTVAVHLAGALARRHPRQVALVELARRFADASLLLNSTVQYSLADACARWEQLDAMSLGACFTDHPSGLKLLASATQGTGDQVVSREAIRRVAVLSRAAFPVTVFSVEHLAEDAEIEAIRLSDRVVLVIRADVPAVRRAWQAIEHLAANGVLEDRLYVVVNRWGQKGQLTLSQIETGLGRKVNQRIPDDPARVNKATNQGLLLQEVAPWAAITRRFRSIARDLTKMAAGRNGKRT